MARLRSLRCSFIFAAVFCSAVAPYSHADVGFDYLGIQSPHWNCDAMLAPLKTLPGKVPAGVLVDHTFGSNDSCIHRLLQSGKVHSLRLHLMNATCVRNRVCHGSEYLFGYTIQSLERAIVNRDPKLFAKLANAARMAANYGVYYPGVKIYVSGLLEHNLSRTAASILVSFLRSVLPAHVDVVDDPANPYAPLPGTILEAHGPHHRAPIVSLDGQSAEDVDIEAFKTHGSMFSLIWARSYNCRLNGAFIDPRRRKNCPSQDQFNLMTRLWHKEPQAPHGKPSSCRSVAPVQSPRLWKTSADDHGTGNKRDNKPIWITKNAWPGGIQILGANGGPIGHMRYAGPYQGGGFRYYLGEGSGQSAFQLGQDAETKAGSEWAYINEAGNCFLINAYRRAGSFR
jgi:hypothetical protein